MHLMQNVFPLLIPLLFQHTTAVNQISIDQNGDYIASCSDDGRVGANEIYHSLRMFCSLEMNDLSPGFISRVKS